VPPKGCAKKPVLFGDIAGVRIPCPQESALVFNRTGHTSIVLAHKTGLAKPMCQLMDAQLIEQCW
jgi:hypothetical protein